MLTENEKKSLPMHVAIIPDGNRRWAKAKGYPVKYGHRQGANTFKEIVRYAGELGIKYISFYAFSTENWKRSPSEVESLMDLLGGFLKNSEKELGKDKDKIKIMVSGKIDRLSPELQKEINRIEEETKENTGIIVNISINYGGRDEILECTKQICRKVVEKEINIDEIDENVFNSHLFTKGLPDPDLLIRTSGEIRISNFLLWQLAYTELYFTEKFWPDFDKKDFDAALKEYVKRQRRFGAN
ncbi:MAG: isoprenyl transferase [Clostridiaceae bacterium]|nr:isoprenyl transferase [Clostridiaceae bacterium]